MRAHCHQDTCVNRDPWLYSPEVQEVIRESIWLRYHLFHYLYHLMYQSHTELWPPLRPMWYEFPHEPKSYNSESQFMFGRDILVSVNKS